MTKKTNDAPIRQEQIESHFLMENDEEAELKYQAIVAYCKTNNTTFHDGELPHITKSFITLRRQYKETKLRYCRRLFRERIRWRRLYDFVEETVDTPEGVVTVKTLASFPKFAIYKEIPLKVFCLRHEVYQGSIGNCAMVAALSSITICENFIENVFSTSEISEFGVYKLRLCFDGEWQYIIVDDWLPHIGTRPCVIRDVWHQMWARLIEKALAKKRGSYAGLIGISSLFTFIAVTGAPTFHLFIKDPENAEENWQRIKEYFFKNYPMTTGSDVTSNLGLNAYHAFSLIYVWEEGPHRLLLLRNPSGISRWCGKWCADWPDWPQDMKKLMLPLQAAVLGSFWICWDDYRKYFGNVSVCRYRPSFHVIRLKMKMFGPSEAFRVIRITVQEDCEICISAINPHQNIKSISTYIAIHCATETYDIGEMIMSDIINESTNDVFLGRGEYVIVLQSLDGWTFQRNVALHTSEPIHARLTDWSPRMITDSFQMLIKCFGRNLLLERNDVNFKKYINKDMTLYALMAENYTDDKYLHVHLRSHATKYQRFSRERGMVDSLEVHDVIPPKHRQVLLYTLFTFMTKRPDFDVKIEYFLSNNQYEKNKVLHSPAREYGDHIHTATFINEQKEEEENEMPFYS